jgi:hypothetical protein
LADDKAGVVSSYETCMNSPKSKNHENGKRHTGTFPGRGTRLESAALAPCLAKIRAPARKTPAQWPRGFDALGDGGGRHARAFVWAVLVEWHRAIRHGVAAAKPATCLDGGIGGLGWLRAILSDVEIPAGIAGLLRLSGTKIVVRGPAHS